MSEPQRKALGRGLSSLLPSRTTAVQPSASAAPGQPPHELPIDQIEPNPLQPRTIFDAQRLEELAQSIRENGVIQPLIVQKAGDRYQLIAGERRWRAAKIASLAKVPVVIRDFASDRLLEISLIENIQREDLNPIEVAHAYDRLNRDFHLTHEDIARRTGKDRVTITNMMRLLKLPPEIQLLIAEHRLSMGHARAVLAIPDKSLQREVADKAVAEGLSVRQVERLVQKMNEPRETKPPDEVPGEPDANTRAAIQELERVLGTRVRISQKDGKKGRIEIEYYSLDDLNRIYQLIVD